MGTSHKISEARLRTILKRQQPAAFGAAYVPAIRAVREEAPRISRFQEVWFHLFDRYISTLSVPERMVLHIILYCPWLFDLHEQWMLPYLPTPHPLSGHVLASSLQLPDFRGTLTVADELGVLKFHPTVTCKPKDGEEFGEVVPFPWIGDFLLFLKDSKGPYCNNITVKSTAEEFEVPQVGVKPSTDILRAAAHERARHKVEEVLTKDVSIPTIRVAADEVNRVVVANLEQIYGWCKRRDPFTSEQREEIVDAFREGVVVQIPAQEVIHHLAATHGFLPKDLKTAMYQAIWRRKIRIDLYQVFFTDHPLIPEHTDVLDEFAHWFKRH